MPYPQDFTKAGITHREGRCKALLPTTMLIVVYDRRGTLNPMKSALQPPSGYPELLQELKTRIRGAQVRASLSVNRELVLLYWSVGRDILVRQENEGWGTGVINRLAHDLQNEFPGIEGFSLRSLKYMRSFAAAWPDEPNSAAGCCTIAMGSSYAAPGQDKIPGGTSMVPPRLNPTRLEPKHSGSYGERQDSREGREGAHQLRPYPPSRRIRYGRADLTGPLQF
jgi:hypothetical protein